MASVRTVVSYMFQFSFREIFYSGLQIKVNTRLSVPLKNQLDQAMVGIKKKHEEFYKKLASNPNMLSQSVEITDLLYRVSALCYIKNQILESLDCENDYKWREMALFILHNIQSHLKLLNCFANLVENSCDITHKQSFLDITCELIWHTLEHSYSMIHYHKGI